MIQKREKDVKVQNLGRLRLLPDPSILKLVSSLEVSHYFEAGAVGNHVHNIDHCPDLRPERPNLGSTVVPHWSA